MKGLRNAIQRASAWPLGLVLLAACSLAAAEPTDSVEIDGRTWASTASGEDLTWQAADAYCRDLRLDGHTDWRLPTLLELATLEDPQIRRRHSRTHRHRYLLLVEQHLAGGTTRRGRHADRRVAFELLLGHRLRRRHSLLQQPGISPTGRPCAPGTPTERAACRTQGCCQVTSSRSSAHRQ
jgi:hypothetical protein